MLEVFAILEKAQDRVREGARAVARDKEFLGRHAITGDTVEGYLFPDTYEFRINEKPRAVLDRLSPSPGSLERSPRAATAATPPSSRTSSTGPIATSSRWRRSSRRKPSIPRSARASRRCSSTASPSRRSSRTASRPIPRFATAARSRRRSPPPASNGNPGDRLHRAQLDDADNPYNTYQHEGLPPGPICEPRQGLDRGDARARRQRVSLFRREGRAQPRVRAHARRARANVARFMH